MLTDGNQVSFISGGHGQMTEVTGTGCLLGSICAAALTQRTPTNIYTIH